MPSARRKFSANMVKLHRQLGAAKARPIGRVPKAVPTTAIEREYAKALETLISQAEEALAPLLDALPKLLGRVEKQLRTDAGEAEKVAALMEEARDRMAKQMTPKKLQAITAKFGKRTEGHQKAQIKKQIQATLGVDILGTAPQIPALMEQFVFRNVGLIKTLPTKLFENIEYQIMSGMSEGIKPAELAKRLHEQVGMAKTRAKIIARDQVGSFYGTVNAARQKSIGVERFIWRTVGDGAVRDEHVDRDGETYTYKDPPDGELPGQPINCRCYAEPVLSDLLEG